MDHAELLKRVREDVQAISKLASGAMNVPLNEYIDKTSLDALCDSLNLEPEAWHVEDLEKILIIRDGLYTLRNSLRDKGDDGEHSIDQFLSAIDRLYADLERAMRSLNAEQVQKAQQEIAALQRTPQVDAVLIPAPLKNLQEEAGELLTRTHITYQRFEINLIKINRLNLNIEVMQNAKLVVQRLSASVFAIKLSLEQNIIYQGVFKFLAEGADKIVDDLRKIAERFKKNYSQAKDFIVDLSTLVEKGHRFTRHVAEFLRDIFGDAPPEQKQLRWKTRGTVGKDTMLCATRINDSEILIAGKDGYINILDVAGIKVTDHHQISPTAVNCVVRAGDFLVAGSDEGLGTINPRTLVSLERDMVYGEKVVAVAAAPWGVVSGTRDGILRQWKINDGALARYGADNLRAGKSVQRMLVHGDEILVAAGDTLLFVGERLNVIRRIPIDFFINDMCLLNHATLILCGNGKIAHVNLTKGIYTRFVPASEDAKYTCVSAMDENIFCAGTGDGTISAIDLASSTEIGGIRLPFPVRGMMKMSNQVVAYGGSWDGNSKNTIAVLTWEEILHRPKEIGLKS